MRTRLGVGAHGELIEAGLIRLKRETRSPLRSPARERESFACFYLGRVCGLLFARGWYFNYLVFFGVFFSPAYIEP